MHSRESGGAILQFLDTEPGFFLLCTSQHVSIRKAPSRGFRFGQCERAGIVEIREWGLILSRSAQLPSGRKAPGINFKPARTGKGGVGGFVMDHKWWLR
jgi:hypothetical protein